MTEIKSEMAPESRVWVYHSDRPFSAEEIIEVNHDLIAFVSQWAAHQIPLTADAMVLHDRFIVIMVDEKLNGASGCSIDASVHFMQKLAQKYDRNLFNRMLFAAKINDEIKSMNRAEFSQLYSEGIINDQTLVFDTLVPIKEKLDSEFLKPLQDSWHKRMVPA